MLTKLNWPNVQQLAHSATLNMVHRAIKFNSSQGLIKMFKVIHPRIPRGKPTISIKHNGKCNRKSHNFSAFASSCFNSLPIQLRCPSLTNKKFKHELKQYIHSNWLLTQHSNEVHNEKRCKRTP